MLLVKTLGYCRRLAQTASADTRADGLRTHFAQYRQRSHISERRSAYSGLCRTYPRRRRRHHSECNMLSGIRTRRAPCVEAPSLGLRAIGSRRQERRAEQRQTSSLEYWGFLRGEEAVGAQWVLFGASLSAPIVVGLG